jgi:hypothetical protein
MGLCINENKTKYMMISRNNHNAYDPLVRNIKFEIVDNFKYFGVNVNNNYIMHQDLNKKL